MSFIWIHLLLLLVLPPFLLGLINKTKAFFAGRVGAPFLQPYYDIFRLMRKGMVISTTTTWVFQFAPLISLGSIVGAGLILPLGNAPSLISFTGDFVLFAYLFALSRFFTVSAALDTGSSFEGMGSSREVFFAALTEPALFFAFLVLAKLSLSFTLSGMFPACSSLLFPQGSLAPLVMISLGLFIVFLSENSRLPVDDPNTHLELTMIHEVMVLDHSGPLLGLIEYCSAVKLFVLASLLVNVCIPGYTGIVWLDYGIFIALVLCVCIVVGILESLIGRLRMNRVPSLLIASILLCGSAFIMLVR